MVNLALPDLPHLSRLMEYFLTASKRLALAVLQVAVLVVVTLWIYLILMTQYLATLFENDRIVSAMQMPSQQYWFNSASPTPLSNDAKTQQCWQKCLSNVQVGVFDILALFLDFTR